MEASFGTVLRDTLGFILGAPVSDTQWAQATIPARLGGLGIQDPVSSRLPARIADLLISFADEPAHCDFRRTFPISQRTSLHAYRGHGPCWGTTNPR